MRNNEILEQYKGAKNVKKSMTVLIVVWIWAFRSLFLRKIDVRQKELGVESIIKNGLY